AGDAPNACSSFSADGAPFTGNADGLSARRTPRTTYPNIAHRDNIAPPTSPVSFDIVATDSTDPGLYTVCIGTTSPQSFVQASGADKLRGVVVRVQLRPWIQIDRPDGSSTSKSGDVHSNGQLDVYIPVNEYFFKRGTAGVVSAANTIQHIQNDRVCSTGLSRWRIPNYSSRVQTRSVDSLLALAPSAQENTNAEFPSQLPTTGNLNSLCAQGAKVYHYRGNWTRSGNLDMSNA